MIEAKRLQSNTKKAKLNKDFDRMKGPDIIEEINHLKQYVEQGYSLYAMLLFDFWCKNETDKKIELFKNTLADYSSYVSNDKIVKIHSEFTSHLYRHAYVLIPIS